MCCHEERDAGDPVEGIDTFLLSPDQAAVVDDHGARWRRQGREKIGLPDRICHGGDDTHGEGKSGQIWVRTPRA